MKNITWMEIVIAMPMVLTLSGLGGMSTIMAAGSVMLLAMVAIKWGKKISLRSKGPRLEAVKVRV